jgi:hypothetical protein
MDAETFLRVLVDEFSEDVMVHWNGDHWHLHVGDYTFSGKTIRAAAMHALVTLYARRAKARLN